MKKLIFCSVFNTCKWLCLKHNRLKYFRIGISKGDFEAAYKVNFNDSKWESVTVPHDWAIYGPFDKNVDIQKVCHCSNGENVAIRKRTNWCFTLISTAWYHNTLLCPKIQMEKKLLLKGL
jgi:beta-galactosidase